MKKTFLLIIFLFFVAFPSQAEVVVLKNGKKLEGQIIARTTQFIKIDIGIGVNLTYYLDQIDSIDNVKIKIADNAFVIIDPLDEINQNADSLAVDIADESYKLINNLDVQKLPEKMDTNVTNQRNPFVEPEQPDYIDENDKMQEFQTFERFRFFTTAFDSLMDSSGTFGLPVVIGTCVVIFLIFWIISCYPFVLMAKTLGLTHRWMAWVPIFQVFLFIRLARVPFWWIIFLFIPFVNFFIPLVLWFKIAESLDRPTWLAFLMYIPLINFFVLWYFAFSKPQPKKAFRF